MVRFFKDDFNARFTWSWINNEFVTDETSVIEHYKGLGIRWEEVKESNPVATILVNKEEKPVIKRGRKSKGK